MDLSITLYDNLSFLWEIGLPFLVALTILVFVHEFGHYIVARWCGVRVEVFSIGFGKELKGWTDKNGTRKGSEKKSNLEGDFGRRRMRPEHPGNLQNV